MQSPCWAGPCQPEIQRLVSGTAPPPRPPTAAVTPHSSSAPPTGGDQKQKEAEAESPESESVTSSFLRGSLAQLKEDALEDTSLVPQTVSLHTDSAWQFSSDETGIRTTTSQGLCITKKRGPW